MGKTPNMKYETPAPDSPVVESVRGKERDPEGSRQSGTYGARRERERESKNLPDFLFFKTLFILAVFFLLREFKKVADKIN